MEITAEANNCFEDCPDIFCRNEIARKMCDLICSSPARLISPVALDGPWGCGKTTHAHRMEKIINVEKSDTHKCIYWNASLSDYASDPLPIFISNIYKYISTEKKKEFEGLAMALCGGFAFGLTTNVGMQILGKPFGLDFAKALDSGISFANIFCKKNQVKRAFRNFLSAASDVESRMRIAKKIVETLAEEKEIIFIIDELDRCRPDFALKMLENIKHLFSETHCKFVLIMNKVSMVSSVQHLYGLDVQEADLYISKFIKIHMQLPIGNAGARFDYIVSYFKFLVKDVGSGSFKENLYIDIMLSRYSELKRLNLREIEKIVDIIRLINDKHQSNLKILQHDYMAFAIVVVACLIVRDSTLIAKIHAHKVTAASLAEALGCTASDCSVPHLVDIQDFLYAIMKVYLSDDVDQAINDACAPGRIHEESLRAAVACFSQWVSYGMLLR